MEVANLLLSLRPKVHLLPLTRRFFLSRLPGTASGGLAFLLHSTLWSVSPGLLFIVVIIYSVNQVVGGKGTGKTSLLRLLLETADISPGATGDQKAAVDRFLKGSTKATQAIQTACVEICESRFDRVLFSVIDTPGLDFQESRELKLERQVTSIIKYVDAQYADTMTEVRTFFNMFPTLP